MTGVECRTLRDAPAWARWRHRILHRWSVKPGVYLPALGRALHRPVARIERRYGRPLRIAADRGVVLVRGRVRVQPRHAARARPGLPRRPARWARPATTARHPARASAPAATTDRLDRVTIWRFLTPPSALQRGLLVDRDGQAGRATSPATARRSATRAAQPRRRGVAAGRRGGPGRGPPPAPRARRCGSSGCRRRWLLAADRVSAPTLDAVAAPGRRRSGRAGRDRRGHHDADAGARIRPASPPRLRTDAGPPAVSLIDCSIRHRVACSRRRCSPSAACGSTRRPGRCCAPTAAACPACTRPAAPPSACARNSYVSGLSLADCVFSGRRAGRSAAVPERGGLHAHRG